MILEEGFPFSGAEREEVSRFLRARGLEYDDGIECGVLLRTDSGDICACGGLQGPVLKCIAVDSGIQGEGLCARVTSALMSRAVRLGHEHIFVFTKPGNKSTFESLGFYEIAETPRMLFMENTRDGIDRFVSSLERGVPGKTGAIVAKCDPFTRGHRYLAETAAAECETVHFFVVSEERCEFSAETRLQCVKEGLAGMKNVIVHTTGDYMVSFATFPEYFLGKTAGSGTMELDLELFAQKIAKPLGITARYVGNEPYSAVTRQYNELMKKLLPGHGIQVREIPRLEVCGLPVSASKVRALLRGGHSGLSAMIPETTAWIIE